VLRIPGVGSIIDLSHADGQSRAWIADVTQHIVGDRPWLGEATAWPQIRAALRENLGWITDRLFQSAVDALTDPEIAPLLTLNAVDRFALWRALGGPELRVMQLPEDPEAEIAVTPPGASAECHISARLLRRLMGIAWDPQLQEMFRRRQVFIPSLLHDGESFRAASIRVTRLDFYIHVSEGPGGPSWVLAIWKGKTNRSYRVRWVLLPDGKTVVAGMESDPAVISAQYGAMMSMYVGAGLVAARLFAPTACPALEFRPVHGNHLGHLVWNHLAGVNRLLIETQAAGQPLPVYDTSVKPGADTYGPLTTIFPELVRQVRRWPPLRTPQGELAVFAAAARSGHSLVSFRNSEVLVSLRTRLRRSVLSEVAAQAVAPSVASILGLERPGGPPPILVLGIRLQNRCPSNLLEVYAALAQRLQLACPSDDLTLVIDGMNVLPDGRVAANTQPLIDRERAFVEALRGALAGSGVRLFSCVGTTMAENFVWLDHADLFVAPQGGGLAKLRWVLHKPGYTLTSAANLKFARRSYLYGHRGGTEAPLPFLCNQAEDVEDLWPNGPPTPGTDPLGGGSGGLSSVNFTVINVPRVLDEIEEMFRQTLGPRLNAAPFQANISVAHSSDL